MPKMLSRAILLLIIMVLGGASALFAQEGTSADGNIYEGPYGSPTNDHQIFASSGTTTLTYRVTNTSGVGGGFFDQIRIYNGGAAFPNMTVTGQIKVNVIRETRAIEYAR